MNKNHWRKWVHISMIGFALLIGRIPPWGICLIAFSAFIFNIILLPKITQRKLENELDLKRGFSLGILMYPAVITLLSLIFYSQQIFLAIGWGALAFGDGFAGLIGKNWGKQLLPWSSTKTWIGMSAFIFMGILCSWGLILLLPDQIYLGLNRETWLGIIAITILTAALVETLPGLIDDNLSVPLVAAICAFICFQISESGAFFLPVNFFLGAFLIFVFVILSIFSGKIDLSGGIVGGCIGMGMFLGGGFGSLGLLLVFFVLGSAVSHWKKKEKAGLGLAQGNEGKRSVRHAFSNAGVAGICGFLAWQIPEYHSIFVMMIAASMAAATSDTFSSELGNVYGTRFVNLLTFTTGTRGQDGVISLEGSLFGLLGSLIIAMIYGSWEGTFDGAMMVFFAGMIGNFMDTVLGATLQRSELMTNDSVNFFCTLSAALFTFL